MQGQSKIQHLKSIIDRALAWLVIVVMASLVIDVLWQVFTRFVLRDPSSFTEELARYLLIWVGLLGASYAAGKRMHLALDLLPMKLEGRRSSATPISWGELYTALQQGVVDGAENNPPSFYISRHYEVCKYYVLDEHTAIPDVLLISTIIWETLTAQEQQWLTEAALESAQHQKQLWKKASDDALRAVQASGVEVIYPDKTPFAEKVTPLYEAYRDEPAIYELIQQIRAVRATADERR